MNIPEEPAIKKLLREYGSSHQNQKNINIHLICVPAILFSILGLLSKISIPFSYINGGQISLMVVAIIFLLGYYLYLKENAFIDGLVVIAPSVLLINLIEYVIPHYSGILYSIVFVAAWIGQFVGHNIEGKKPSFLRICNSY